MEVTGKENNELNKGNGTNAKEERSTTAPFLQFIAALAGHMF